MTKLDPNVDPPLELSLVDDSIRGAISTRPIEMPRDWPQIREIHEACRERDRIDVHSVCYRVPSLNLEQYSNLISEAPVTILLMVDGEAVAHGWMETWGEQEIAYLWRVWVKPAHRNKGLGTALLRWGEACALDMQARNGKPGRHLANATEHEADAVGLLEAEGYAMNFISPELAFDDWHLLGSSAPSTEIEVRPVLESEVGQVTRCLAEANLPGSEAGERSVEELEREIQAASPYFRGQCDGADLSLSRAAWRGDRLVGVVLGSIKEGVGDLPQVAVAAEARGKGVARELVNATLVALRSVGCLTVRLFTSIGPDESLPAQGPYVMYVKFGFKPIARHLRFHKPMDANE